MDHPATPTIVSVAHQAGEQWRVQFTVLTAGAHGGYAPASSLDALDA